VNSVAMMAAEYIKQRGESQKLAERKGDVKASPFVNLL